MESTFNKVGNKVIEKIEEKQRAYEDKLIEEFVTSRMAAMHRQKIHLRNCLDKCETTIANVEELQTLTREELLARAFIRERMRKLSKMHIGRRKKEHCRPGYRT